MRVVAPHGLVADRYRLLHPLGSGASATVWAAEDETLGRRVALKVLSGSAAEDDAERAQLRREARALAALTHPHIITVFDFLETAGLDGAVQPVLVTELLEGVSLADRLADGPLPWLEALSVCGQLADALAAAHQAGIVHRDVTPANVMLADSGVKLLDFGIAKDAAEDSTVKGSTVGTPVCMAPEQLTGQPAQPASDVYALGCVLHWCLTGRPPFREKDFTWLSHAHLHAAPAPLAIAGLPQGINEFYLACLEKEPDQRPTAGQAAATLAPYAPKSASTSLSPSMSPSMPTGVSASMPGSVSASADSSSSPDDATQTLPMFAFTAADTDAAADSAMNPDSAGTSSRSSAGRHSGPGRPIDRRRLLPVGLLLGALVIVALLIFGLAHAMTGGGTSGNQATATGTASTAPSAGASGTATVASVTLPSGSAAASSPSAHATHAASPSPSPSQSASPSRTPAAPAIPALPNPATDPLGYVQGISNQIQALVAQGPSMLQANAGQALRNSVDALQAAIASAQQSGGRKQWRNVANSISGVQQQIAGDASTGRISAAAASVLTGELRRLANSLPANGN